MALHKFSLSALCASVLAFTASAHAMSAFECAREVAILKFAGMDPESDLQQIIDQAQALYPEIFTKCPYVPAPPVIYHSEFHNAIVHSAEGIFNLHSLIRHAPLSDLAKKVVAVEAAKKGLSVGQARTLEVRVVPDATARELTAEAHILEFNFIGNILGHFRAQGRHGYPEFDLSFTEHEWTFSYVTSGGSVPQDIRLENLFFIQ